jgi:penicillin-binding protein 1A
VHSRSRQLNHFTEEVRRQVEARYGRDMLYKGGLTIHTTLDPNAQQIAERALDRGLRELDDRQNRYRPPRVNIPRKNWLDVEDKLAYQNGELSRGKVVLALVTSCNSRTETCELDLGVHQATIGGSGGQSGETSSSPPLRMFRSGDVIHVRLEKLLADNTWSAVLEHNPGTEGALVVIEPKTGKIVCMVGGTDFGTSQFNRATQAVRQPGSAFKPIIYAAALDKGYTEASILMDTPLVRDYSPLDAWNPTNSDHRFMGPITFWKALVQSRNLASVKLLDSIGVDYAISYARKLGITSQLTPSLSLALGASGVTPLELATAYTPFANQGERVEPYLIESIADRNGSLIEAHQVQRERVISSQTAYIITHMLQDVVQKGTATKAKALGRPAAGKTGTTNELKDAWFIGYTPSVLAAVWVGNDDHNVSLGDGETGTRAACPVWSYFMQEYLKDKSPESFSIPSGVVMARMDPKTGAILNPYDRDGVYAAFAGSPPVQELQPPDSVLAHGPQRPGTVYPRSHNPFSSMFEGLKGGLGSIFRR